MTTVNVKCGGSTGRDRQSGQQRLRRRHSPVDNATTRAQASLKKGESVTSGCRSLSARRRLCGSPKLEPGHRIR